jgi:hypothetical protein
MILHEFFLEIENYQGEKWHIGLLWFSFVDHLTLARRGERVNSLYNSTCCINVYCTMYILLIIFEHMLVHHAFVASVFFNMKLFWRMLSQRENGFLLDWVNAKWYNILNTALVPFPSAMTQSKRNDFRVDSLWAKWFLRWLSQRGNKFQSWLSQRGNHFGANWFKI